MDRNANDDDDDRFDDQIGPEIYAVVRVFKTTASTHHVASHHLHYYTIAHSKRSVNSSPLRAH